MSLHWNFYQLLGFSSRLKKARLETDYLGYSGAAFKNEEDEEKGSYCAPTKLAE